MTEVAQTYLGNINENPDLSELVKIETCLEVYLTESDRNKGRIHTYTDAGVAVGIIKSRDRSLHSGDLFKTESGNLLLVHLQEQQLLVLDFSRLETNISPARLVYLGHVLGNHHYPIAIQDNKIYIQFVTDKNIIKQTIIDLNIPGLQISWKRQKADQEISFASHSH